MPVDTTLIDAGPMVALINRNDPHYARCTEVLRSFSNVPPAKNGENLSENPEGVYCLQNICIYAYKRKQKPMTDMLEPATTLDDVYQTLSPEPLDDGSKLNAFYSNALNDQRGGDKVEGILLNLGRHFGKTYYRAFLMGHQGVGKSTELSRLINDARFQFRPICFSATKDLNPAGFTPFDVLLVMLVRLMDEMSKCDANPPSDSLLNDVKEWFATTTHTTLQQSDASLEATAEIAAKTPSLLAYLISLGAKLTARQKYTTDREIKTIKVETASIPGLI